MAGFDAENVFYYAPDTNLFPPEEYGVDGLTVASARIKFEQFFRVFCQGSHYLYGDVLLRDKQQVKVDLSDLSKFDKDMAHALREDPMQFLPVLEAAAASVVSAYHIRDAEGQEMDFSGLQVLLRSSDALPGPSSLRELSSEHISKLVMIPGIVTAAANPKHKATHITLQCKDCNTTKVITVKPGVGGATIPRRCDANAQGGPLDAPACSLDPYQILASNCQFVDTQSLKMQERPEDVPTGDLPRSMQLIADRRLVGQVAPGTRVTAYAIYSVYQSKQQPKDQAGVAIRVPYLRIVGLDQEDEGAHSTPTFTLKEEQEFKEFAANAGALDNIFSRMAPQIFGHENIKKALACLLFGGARKQMPDGTFRRGDVNVLLLGDPSTAKSQFLKFASNAAPIAVYTSGRGSSAAGLTATVVKSPGGEFYLEGGAMVLADNGVVCIDEFDKMQDEDRVALHEAMEQQTISVAKAGITTMLKSRTSVLAAANPPSGRYDDLKSADENIALASTILSRFDLIFIVKDERSVEMDQQIARHVLRVHRNAGESIAVDEQQAENEKFLKRYLKYARLNCSPRLSEAASDVLIKEYVELRAQARQAAEESKSDMPAVPITVRQLEAIVRISESLARMQLLVEANETHVRQALELFKFSTMDAVRSGVVDLARVTPEQRQELQSIEVQINRRVALGSTVSERKLIEDLARFGLNESLVTRAICLMVETRKLEHFGTRRMLRRMQ